MAHRQSNRKGPATIVPPPSTDHEEEYTYQDTRDAQQIADDSVAFLRTFSLRLKRFRAQVGEFAHASPHTDDAEMSDGDSTKLTTATTRNTKLNEPLSASEASEQDDSLDGSPAYAHKSHKRHELPRTEPPEITSQSPVTRTNQIPPCPDNIPDESSPENAYVTTRKFSIPPSLRGTYVDEYLRRTYATIGPKREDLHIHNPPAVADDNGNDTDEFNGGVNPTTDQRLTPCEPETMKAAYGKTFQLTKDTQQTAHTGQRFHETTLPGRPDPGLVTPNEKRTRYTIDPRAHPPDITRNHRADPPGHKKPTTVTPIAKETERTIYDLIRMGDTTKQDIEGLVPDRGKKPRYRTRRVSVIYMPT